MATVKEMKATARPRAGKGAARAERRAGRVPGVIYGDRKPPLTISIDYAELRQKIYAGRLLTTIYDLDIDGEKHRVIPRDFQLDAVRDNPVHVDFMRLGERREMANRPRDHVAVAVQIAFSAVGRAEYARDVARDRRLLGQHGNRSAVRGGHVNSQFSAPLGGQMRIQSQGRQKVLRTWRRQTEVPKHTM